jgi:hypothetical protein
VPEMHRFQQLYSNEVQCLAIYISEAHAVDEWPIGSKVAPFEQPKTLEERLALANRFKTDFNFEIPTLVDSMDKSKCFEDIYGAWPEQFFAIDRKGLLVFKGYPTELGFTSDVFDQLRTVLGEHRIYPSASTSQGSSGSRSGTSSQFSSGSMVERVRNLFTSS